MPPVREKTLAEAWLTSGTLDYTILRPGGLLDGKTTGDLRVITTGRSAWRDNHRQEVARVLSKPC
ncbi:NAD(P)H-binding protein [Vibrio lentus]|nr:NAD(P)H-binding protein [Vibrio lentus]